MAKSQQGWGDVYMYRVGACHRRVVLMRRTRVEEALVHLERPLQVEGAQVEDRLRRDPRLLAALDRREGVERAQSPFDARHVFLSHEVHLVEE